MRANIVYFFVAIMIALQPITAVAQRIWTTLLNYGLYPLPATSGRYDDIFFISKDTGVVVSSYGMIFKTDDGAQDWRMVADISMDVYFRSVEFGSNGQVGIAGSLNGYILRSEDRGETWSDISANISDTGIYAKRICGLAHCGNNFYGVGWWGSSRARFYKSTDAGLTWTTSYIDTSLATGLVDVVFLSENKGFATGVHGYLSGTKAESVVLRTLDGGATWTKVFADTTIGGRIWKIQFVDNDYGVGSVEPIYRDTVAMIKTTDGGDTWQLITIGSVNAWTYGWGTQGIGFLNRQKGWVGGYYDGMFETTDGGATWDTIEVGKECNRYFLIDSTLYVSGHTVYKNMDTTTYPSDKVIAQSSAFLHKLYPLAPNPAKGKVCMEFDINKHQTNVVLQVVNTDGRRVYKVADGYMKPGHYSYTWDGTNAPDGNYIVWLGTDEIPIVQKFVLHK